MKPVSGGRMAALKGMMAPDEGMPPLPGMGDEGGEGYESLDIPGIVDEISIVLPSAPPEKQPHLQAAIEALQKCMEEAEAPPPADDEPAPEEAPAE